MRTEEDLRAAYTDLAGHAPDPQMMLAAHQRRTQPRRHRRIAALKASGALVAAATAAATALAVLPGAAAPGTGGLRSARNILLTAAVSAARQPASGVYWHTSVLQNTLRPGKAGSNGTVIASELVNTWVSSSPSHRSWRTERWLKGNPGNLATGGPVAHLKGKNTSHVSFSYSDPAQSFTVFFMTVGELEHLPASPSRLATALRQAARRWIATPASASYVNSILWNFAFDLLKAPISPQLRAAAFRVLAQLPGVTSVGRIRDSRGRLGYRVQMSGAVLPGHNKYTDQFRFTDTLVVNPRTGIVLDDLYTERQGGQTTGAGDAILIRQGWTNRGPALRPCLEDPRVTCIVRSSLP